MPNPSTITMQEEYNGHVLIGGGDPSKPYHYLAGGMTGHPGLNFPVFYEAAEALRAQGYNIISPAELDSEIERRIIEQASGTEKLPGLKSWADCMRRDVQVVLDPNCVGIILLPGWEQSTGARLETYVANALGLPLYLYDKKGSRIHLTMLSDRRAALDALGIVE